jgi:hypothetical protein
LYLWGRYKFKVKTMKTLRELFTGRSNNVTNELTFQTSESKVAGNQTLYQCPMKCEGNKMYKEPGNCPVCNMKLVPASTIGKSTHTDRHHGCC